MPGFLELDRVNRIYESERGALHALKDVTLSIQEGEFISIVGPSGCGKSTLLKCMAGLERATSGLLSLQGRAIVEPPRNMGVVFQRDLLLEWRNILDNVLLAAEFHDVKPRDMEPRARELLTLFGLGQFLERFPRELSGGMRQRVSICRALLLDPQLLLMDEPFGALDPFTRDELNAELQRTWLATGKTVVFITHSIAEAVYLGCRVVIMARGPGRIEEVVPIEIERPRGLGVRETPAFVDCVKHIRDTFRGLGIYKE
ncbi:Bicarbonate transport ATP-binding protein CmpD [Achromobacter denitrificans]|jgi:NitT/TauT family transport system ATP-binding protein|uniref:ABC transporter ATP-binding protein n=1 Tax=Achromobacter denitrificans TaxID=32002 RepID=UPI0007885365|nr:ABC transporter ATP-binding protein [Achromobacter denitrificans]OLU00290.1 nitrate/sulfonate/bicarbonate ABC transporter ATP-binding protein [Achromobacter denitrificans]QKH42265.1 ABC transporter ATP-binding protein [Achromobacter denitrificans]QKH50591.1 ABC transporter ATP-binding protein [Achromobacter denitrificans]CAB3744162.1 Nitrate import ATP-binding protein NrtD [Achromobacter denitrificans]SUU22040.1 Bicarbonate transport ATP-binding protein CmpD [Achromobacter denitrificans]